MLRWVPRWLRWTFAALVLGLVLVYVVWPQLGDAGDALTAATRLNPLLLLVASLLQALGIACQVELTRAMLPAETRPSFGAMGRVELASMAVSHTVPGGTAAGTALAYRLMISERGARGADVGFALGVRGIGSALVLNAILWVALVASIPTTGFEPRYTVAAVLGALLLGFAGVVAAFLLRGEERVRDWSRRVARALPLLDEEAVGDAMARLGERLRQLTGDRHLAVRAVGWSAGYWLLGAASLWVFLVAVGDTVNPLSLVVAYGVVNVLAAIPITPRGLGLVEGALVPMLVGFGAAAGPAALAVVAWRLVSFWLPIPLGGLAYASLKVGSRQPALEPRDTGTVDDLVRATEDAEPLQEWLRNRGISTHR